MLRYAMRRALSTSNDTAQFDRLYTFGEDIDRDCLQRSASASARWPVLRFRELHGRALPYVPPAPFDTVFPGRRTGVTQDDLESDMAAILRKGKRGRLSRALRIAIRWRHRLRGPADRQGRGLAQAAQPYDNTMIVVTSDHGESFGEKKRFGHANSPTRICCMSRC